MTRFEAWTLNSTNFHQPDVTAHLAEQLGRVWPMDIGLRLYPLLFPVQDQLNTGQAQNDHKVRA